jgi:hypothetical protein
MLVCRVIIDPICPANYSSPRHDHAHSSIATAYDSMDMRNDKLVVLVF